jgi:hypothetical protein
VQKLEKEPKLVLRQPVVRLGKERARHAVPLRERTSDRGEVVIEMLATHEWRMGYGNFCRRKSNDEVHDCAVVIGAAER